MKDIGDGFFVKHTPGPWTYSDTTFYVFSEKVRVPRIADPENRDMFALISMPAIQDVGSDEAHANARLVAAAPELLYACRIALQFIRNGFEYGYIRTPEEGDAAYDTEPLLIDTIRKAIGATR